MEYVLGSLLLALNLFSFRLLLLSLSCIGEIFGIFRRGDIIFRKDLVKLKGIIDSIELCIGSGAKISSPLCSSMLYDIDLVKTYLESRKEDYDTLYRDTKGTRRLNTIYRFFYDSPGIDTVEDLLIRSEKLIKQLKN